VGSGSGGPAVNLALARGCRVTGVNINQRGVRNARGLAAAHGIADRVQFHAIDAGQPLPFPEGRFDAIVSNDAMCHIQDRQAVLQEWSRVLRPGGRSLFTDAMVLTGIASHEELATRSSIGFYLSVRPPRARMNGSCRRLDSKCSRCRISPTTRRKCLVAGMLRELVIGRLWLPGMSRRISTACNGS
jgi:SAM-dependent methyltransferase